jgi:hypothetical protein
VLLEVRQTDVAGLRWIEHDEDVRELNKRNKEDWKNDKMVRGLRFFADSSVRVPHHRDSPGP